MALTPDLTCLGKVIGGGLPVGAFGGKREIMEHMAPGGPVYQAGYAFGQSAGDGGRYTTLKLLGEPGVYEELERKSARLEQGMREMPRKPVYRWSSTVSLR